MCVLCRRAPSYKPVEICWFWLAKVDAILATRSQVGERTTLKCHTELSTGVVWTYRKSLADANHISLVLEGDVINDNKVKYELQHSATGDYDLVIKRVMMDNDGFYTCTEDEGFGRQHHNYLYVFGGAFSCFCNNYFSRP